MITLEQKKILSDLNISQYGNALRDFLQEKISFLEDVRTIPKDAFVQAEVIGRQRALEIVDDLFGFMEGIQKTKKAKNQYQ